MLFKNSVTYNKCDHNIYMLKVVWTRYGRRKILSSRKSLTEKAVEIEKTISVKEHKSERHDFETGIFTKIIFEIGGRMA